MPKINQRVVILIAVGLTGVIVAAAAGWIIYNHNQPLIPPKIDNQLDFKPLLPVKGQAAGFILNRQSFKYDPNIKVMSYVVKSNNNSITVSEQNYPSILIYSSLTGAMHEYAEIDTKIGTVALTYPGQLHGKQSAVTNADNLLLFADPQQGSLNQQQWTEFFNNLYVGN